MQTDARQYEVTYASMAEGHLNSLSENVDKTEDIKLKLNSLFRLKNKLITKPQPLFNSIKCLR